MSLVKDGGDSSGLIHRLFDGATLTSAAKAKGNADGAGSSTTEPSGEAVASVRSESTPHGPASPVILQGKWDELQKEYCTFLMEQVDCPDWKKAFKFARGMARKHFLELAFCHAQSKFASNKLVTAGVTTAIAGQWVRNIKKFSKKR